MGSKVQLSRDPDGHANLTWTEMRVKSAGKKYLTAKESIEPTRNAFGCDPLNPNALLANSAVASHSKGATKTTWDSRTSPEDMEAMWNNSAVSKEWAKSGERRGKVRFSHDVHKNPYLSRVELRAVAEIIVAKHFHAKGLNPTYFCAISEMVSMRFVNGVGNLTGVMGIDYRTACWLYKDMGYKGYVVKSVEDLTKPFVSMYFGAAYMCWLSEYDGRKRTLQFVVQAYLAGPQNVNHQETGPRWAMFEETLCRYQAGKKRNSSSCSIM